jgi:hypothetical protein
VVVHAALRPDGRQAHRARQRHWPQRHLPPRPGAGAQMLAVTTSCNSLCEPASRVAIHQITQHELGRATTSCSPHQSKSRPRRPPRLGPGSPAHPRRAPGTRRPLHMTITNLRECPTGERRPVSGGTADGAVIGNNVPCVADQTTAAVTDAAGVSHSTHSGWALQARAGRWRPHPPLPVRRPAA